MFHGNAKKSNIQYIDGIMGPNPTVIIIIIIENRSVIFYYQDWQYRVQIDEKSIVITSREFDNVVNTVREFLGK